MRNILKNIKGETLVKMNTIENSAGIYKGITALPSDTVTTMAYVPFQLDNSMYEADNALCRGTLFPELDKPFLRAAIR